VQAGYAFGNNPIRFSGNAPLAAGFAAGAFPASLANDPDGVIGGIQWGSNYQFNRMVVGFASDLSFGSIRARQITTTAAPGFATFTNFGEQELSWFGTTRVRAGVLLSDNILVYGTGGLASGRIELEAENCAAGGLCAVGSRKRTRWGWALGGGVEYGFGRWSLNLEYLHYDLGKISNSYFDPLFPGPVFTASTRVSGDLVRAGLNYRFNWTPLGVLLGSERLTVP
jgi:outer membrane immunogenic protein